MKKERQLAVLKVIAATDVETQNQLIEELSKSGFESTQATVSRDIKELHLIKELTPRGTYRYTASGRAETQNQKVRMTSIFKESIISYTTAQNIVVIKTLPGLAPAACGALDTMSINDLVGTIAGDDTAFLAMRDSIAAEKFCAGIEDMLV
ncbi:MAG: arginine repressor [Oscillospiraceae bacterium]|nr:arginine repressor [Oscillospiraceae bacterium]MCL2278941.1 arginine repressor [Oscillospiraceae bacterium]